MYKKNIKMFFLTIMLSLSVFPITASADKKKDSIFLDQSGLKESRNDIEEDSYLTNSEWADVSLENDDLWNIQDHMQNHTREIDNLQETDINDLLNYFYENTENNDVVYFDDNEYFNQSLDLDKTTDQSIIDENRYNTLERINSYYDMMEKNFYPVIHEINEETKTLQNITHKKYKNLSFDEIKIVDQYHNNEEIIFRGLSEFIKISQMIKAEINIFLNNLPQTNSPRLEILKQSLRNRIEELEKKDQIVNEIYSRYDNISKEYESNIDEYNKNVDANILLSESIEDYYYKNKNYIYKIEPLMHIYKKFEEASSIINSLKRDLPYIKDIKNFQKMNENEEKLFLKINDYKIFNFYEENISVILNKLHQLNSDINFLKEEKANLNRRINRNNMHNYRRVIAIIDEILKTVKIKKIQKDVIDLIQNFKEIYEI